MAIFNTVIMDGYLGSDPKDQAFEGGLRTSFSLGFNPGPNQPTLWQNCRITSWIKGDQTGPTPAERAFTELKKGDHVVVHGRFVSWESKKEDGTAQTLFFFEIERFSKLERKPQSENRRNQDFPD